MESGELESGITQEEVDKLKREVELRKILYKEYQSLQEQLKRPVKDKIVLPKYDTSKVFITGLYGSGKTTLALQYSSSYKIKYINFDKYFNYASLDNKVNAAKDFINILSDNFVCDAIPVNFSFGIGYEDFLEYCSSNDITIICSVCPNPDVWIERANLPRRKLHTYQAYVDYAKFYFSLLPIISHLPIVYVDTYNNEFISRQDLYERISWIKPLLNYI